MEQAGNQSLSKYAFVVLSDVGTMPAGLENSLRAYVNGGGSLLIALGPLSAALTHVPVSGETIQGSSYASLSGSRFETVASADAEHPTLAARQQAGRRQVLPGDQGRSRANPTSSPASPTRTRCYSKSRSAKDASSCSPPPSTTSGTTCRCTLRLFRSSKRLRAIWAASRIGRPIVAVDSYIELRSAKERGAAIDVTEPDGTHPLSLKDATTAQTFQVTREGFYDIHRANGRQEMVAVHADRRESDLTPIPQETLVLWKNTGLGPDAPSGDRVGSRQSAAPLEPVALRFATGPDNGDNRISTCEPISFGGEGGRLNAIDQLNSYLQRLEKRLRFLALSKGTSLVTVSALVITVLLVWIINRYAFSPASLLTARIFLFLSVAVAIAFGLVIPLLNLNRRNAARKAEQKFPEFQERLLTLAEKPNAADPFLAIAGRRHHANRRIQRARTPGS